MLPFEFFARKRLLIEFQVAKVHDREEFMPILYLWETYRGEATSATEYGVISLTLERVEELWTDLLLLLTASRLDEHDP